MNAVEQVVGAANDAMWGTILIAVLIGLGLWFTIRTDFVQFRNFKEMIRLIFDKRMVSAEGKKGTSSFQAFAISAASRVGTGNLAGVASAVAVGGPGAIFWMWLIAMLGSATAFVESTLAQVYKTPDKDQYRGGPAYYMEKGLNQRWLGIVFAITITFTYGLVFNSVQSNTISLAFSGEFDVSRNIMALVLVVLTAIVIFGGLKSIATVTQYIVPIMSVMYIILAVYILVMNIAEVPSMIGLIFSNAFGIREVAGGGFGAAIMMGIKRGLFSNEAGMGSAPNAAATAEVTHPAKQGFIQALGVFFDTILMCSATGFILVSAGGYADSDLDGIQLTQQEFEFHIGTGAAIFIAIAIFFFAYSSILGNYYYGENNMDFIKNSKLGRFLYRIAVLLMVVFGAVATFDLVWQLADLTMGIMALINLYAITRLFGVARRVLRDYRDQRKAGKDPVFYRDTLDDTTGVDYWGREQVANKGE
ncbi:alanine/glycine:cation symporter family protein [Lentibacillus juripiscarius]|uniref:Alanine/glycine:cation symporter family protein n=1 Tax=Lentibacillus juripiscarius TaxID=257446 RepID=A0ABW5V831_9BACI